MTQHKMPRFEERFVQILKQQMAKRLPECYFTQSDIEEIVKNTGLNAAQVSEWAENFRKRIHSPTERENALCGDESSNKVT